MLTEHTYWKLNDAVDYDNFMKQAKNEGCKWIGGQEPTDLILRNLIHREGFPCAIEVDKSRTLAIASEKVISRAYDYKTYCSTIKPLPLKENIATIPDTKTLTALSFKDKDGNTLNFTEEGVRNNLEDILKTIRKRFTSFRVGDRVKITNPGKTYVTYSDWFEENQISVSIAARYAYGQDVKENTLGTIKFIGKHRRENDKILCLIEADQTRDGKPFYLVEASGLEWEEK